MRERATYRGELVTVIEPGFFRTTVRTKHGFLIRVRTGELHTLEDSDDDRLFRTQEDDKIRKPQF